MRRFSPDTPNNHTARELRQFEAWGKNAYGAIPPRPGFVWFASGLSDSERHRMEMRLKLVLSE
jgi:hypothetical protein